MRTAGVFGEGDCRNLKLARHPGHESVGWLVEIGERCAGIAQQGELHGAAKAVGVATTFGHKVPIDPLVIKRYDGLELMMKGVSADGTEIVGAGWMDLADGAGKLLPEPKRPSHGEFSYPHYDGSMRTMERMAADIQELFRRTKTLVRDGWPDRDEAGAPTPDNVDEQAYVE